MPVTRRLLVVALVTLLGAAGTIVVWSVTWMSEQVTNSMLVQLCERGILAEKIRIGQLPIKYPCDDVWRRPIRYVKLQNGFALVSYGKDGVPDAEWNEEKLGKLTSGSTCLHPDTDTVVVNGGARRVCLK
jgi:hypothetical protein